MEKILVAGAGAIGGITGAYMTLDGKDVTLFDIDKKHVEKINKDGLFIDGIRGKKKVKVKAVTRIRGKYDIVFLAVKSQYTEDALKRIIPHLKENAIVVSLQNGINEEGIAKKIGIKRTIGCVIGWSATNVGAGHLRLTSEGKFIIGRLDGKIDGNLKKVKELLESFSDVEITDNIIDSLWTKLMINSAIASIGAISVKTLGEMVKDRKSIVILALLANELVKVAENAGIKLEKFEGLDPKLFKIYDYEDFKRVVAIMKIAGEKHHGLKSTMLQDLEKGKKTEIDYLNGYIEKKAEEIGIETPINKELIKIIKEIENGKRKLSPKNIDEIYKRIRIPKNWINFNENELDF